MKYSAEQIDYLREQYQFNRVPELSALFNTRFGETRSQGAINACLSNRKITSDRKAGALRGTLTLMTWAQATVTRAIQ